MPKRFDQRLEEAEKRVCEAAPTKASRPDLLADAFDAQRAFITSPTRKRWALCNRRAAKSYALAITFLDDALDHPGCEYLICGLTRPDVKNVFWRQILYPLDKKHGLNAKFNESDLSMTLPNKARLRLMGGDGLHKVKKPLGTKLRAAGLDEVQVFHPAALHELVFGTLGPALMDLKGLLLLTGTPSNITTGLWYDLTGRSRAGAVGATMAGWEGFSWVAAENPHVRDEWLAEVADLRKAHPHIEEVPWFRQNYLGEWISEPDSLVYKYNPDRNDWDGILPAFEDKSGRWHHALGIDMGFYPDPSACVVISWHDFSEDLYVRESWVGWRQDLTQLARKIEEYEDRYHLDAMVIDGAMRQAVEEMRRRHVLPLIDAKKSDKVSWINTINTEFITGRIKIDADACNEGVLDDAPGDTRHQVTSLVDELRGLVWDPRKLAMGKRVEHASCPNHLCDALNYAVRHAYPYLKREQAIPPAPYTEAWFHAEAQRMMEAEWAEMARKAEEDADGGPPAVNIHGQATGWPQEEDDDGAELWAHLH